MTTPRSRNRPVVRVLRLMRLMRAPSTADELCLALAIEKRTLWRDMDVLREVGVPVRKRHVGGRRYLFSIDTEQVRRAATHRRRVDSGKVIG